MNIILGILKDSVSLFNEMSPYLLFGFVCAGVLHVFIDESKIVRHLGEDNLMSVVKAALLGIPLPVCSCGVIPMAMSLKKQGASSGAILSFLISTPTTGVDSILATYSLLGPVFMFFRVCASFVAGIFSGIIVNVLGVTCAREVETAKSCCKMCDEEAEHSHSLSSKTRAAMDYAFNELLSDVGRWILIGVVLGGVITYLIPDDLFQHDIFLGWRSMFFMLLVGIPMYVCATGSIPIAAALLLKGMSPGAALVFLMAGPATNAVTMTVVGQSMGKKTLVIYLFSIAVIALTLGLLMNYLWEVFALNKIFLTMHHGQFIPQYVKWIFSTALFGLMLKSIIYGHDKH